jgi:ATP-dependent Clp protease, protease subunit
MFDHTFATAPTIPIVTEETGRGERSTDIFSRLLGRRVVFMGTAIDDALANVIVAELIHLDAEDADAPIRLYINSPGGEMSSMLAIYDTMQHVRSPVETVCIGMAASAAAVILAGGARGRRAALPHARVMIHQPHVPHAMQGQAADIAIHAAEVVRMRRQMSELLAADTNHTVAEVMSDTERDRWMPAPEAKEYGLIDLIL